MPKNERKTLIKKLDIVISKYVIQRDGFCVQCGSPERLTCGHLFSRRLMSVRFDLDNCHCQCWPDNFRHGQWPEYYTAWFLKEYGQEKYLELEVKAHTLRKWSIPELKSELERIQGLISELQ